MRYLPSADAAHTGLWDQIYRPQDLLSAFDDFNDTSQKIMNFFVDCSPASGREKAPDGCLEGAEAALGHDVGGKEQEDPTHRHLVISPQTAQPPLGVNARSSENSNGRPVP